MKVGLLGIALGLAGGASAPSYAQACGALPDATFRFERVLPRDGATGVSISAPLAFSLRCEPDESWVEIVREASCAHLPVHEAELTLTRRQDTTPVSGQLQAFGGQLVFVPDAPLLPETEYAYVATLRGAAQARLEGSFRTGSAALDPLRADALPAPALEVYEGNAAKCSVGDGEHVRLTGQAADDALAPAICPNGLSCTADGKGSARRFVVQVSGVDGGYSALGYEAQLRLSFRAAANSGTVGQRLAHLPAGAPETLALDLPELDQDAEVCAHLRVYDAVGSEVVREVCEPYADLIARTSGPPHASGGADAGPNADGTRPDAARPGQQGEGARPDDPASGQDVAVDQADTGSCSLAATTSRGAPAAWVLATLLSVLLRRRRARS